LCLVEFVAELIGRLLESLLVGAIELVYVCIVIFPGYIRMVTSYPRAEIRPSHGKIREVEVYFFVEFFVEDNIYHTGVLKIKQPRPKGKGCEGNQALFA
jgi:hypothetical protein